MISSALPLFCEGASRIKWHLERRHRVWLVTGTLAPLARAVAWFMPCGVAVCGTEIEVRDERFTGRLSGAHMSYGEKARAAREIAAANAFDLAQSYAYGNQLSDLRMLEAVGNPVAVNPNMAAGTDGAKATDGTFTNGTNCARQEHRCAPR